MKIAIFASVWAQNLGDELILKNEIAAIESGKIFPVPIAKTFSKRQQSSLFDFRVFTYDKNSQFFHAENVTYIEYFPIWLRSIKNLFKNLVNCYRFVETVIWADFIIVWGGGLFYDSELQASQNNLNLWRWRTGIFRFFSKKVIFYGISIDIKNLWNKKLIQEIFDRNFRVFVRDEATRLFLQDIWVTSKEIWDPVFYDNGEDFPKKSLALKTIPSNQAEVSDFDDINMTGKVIWVAIRQWYFKEGKDEWEFVKESLSALLKKGVKKIVLLPMSFHPSDYQANDYYFLRNFISENIVMGGENMQEVYNNFKEKKIDMCIAMRLHSIILSQVYQIPYIALSYSRKTDEILKKLSK